MRASNGSQLASEDGFRANPALVWDWYAHHVVRFAHCVQTTAASQKTKRAARADPGPALLVATE
jgi:NAD-dependent SIR2 family protein deacetylase